MKNTSATPLRSSTPLRTPAVTSTLVPMSGQTPAGQRHPGNFVRAGGTQAATTQAGPVGAAQSMHDWSTRLTQLYMQPYGPTLEQAQAMVAEMCADPSLPLKLVERAAIESATLLHHTDLPDFERFVDDVRNQASAFAASAGVPQFPSGGAVHRHVQAPVLTASQPQPQPQPRTQAEALAHWGGVLSALAGQSGGAALDRLAVGLLEMGEDMDLPAHVRSAALDTLLDTPHHERARQFQAFSRSIADDASAFVRPGFQPVHGPAGDAPALPAARSFGTPQQVSPGHAPGPAFVRTVQGAGASTSVGAPQRPLAENEEFALSSSERPMLLQEESAKVTALTQYMLQHPGLTNNEYIRHARDIGLANSYPGGRSLFGRAREHIAFGLEPRYRDQVLDLLAQHRSSPNPHGFGMSVAQNLRSQQVNPKAFAGLIAAAQAMPTPPGPNDTLTWGDLKPHVRPEDERILRAMFEKDVDEKGLPYRTAGRVSPTPFDPANQPAAPVLVQPQPQSQPSLPLPLPPGKRLRADDGAIAFGPGVPSGILQAAQQPMLQAAMPIQPQPQPQPQLPATLQMPQPQPLAVQAMPLPDVALPMPMPMPMPMPIVTRQPAGIEIPASSLVEPPSIAMQAPLPVVPAAPAAPTDLPAPTQAP